MAQKYIVQLVDDLSGEQLDDGNGETVTFSLDGVSYAIDLSKDNATKMRSALDPYVAAARKADLATASKARSTRSSSAASKTDLKDVRDWASKNGFEVSSRGRIPSNVQEAYAAAH
jgi:hypothetical protein